MAAGSIVPTEAELAMIEALRRLHASYRALRSARKRHLDAEAEGALRHELIESNAAYNNRLSDYERLQRDFDAAVSSYIHANDSVADVPSFIRKYGGTRMRR